VKLKEKTLPSASQRMATGFFHSIAYAGEPAMLRMKKALPLSRKGFFFCRGGRINSSLRLLLILMGVTKKKSL
jgi:hypothetical protein